MSAAIRNRLHRHLLLIWLASPAWIGTAGAQTTPAAPTAPAQPAELLPAPQSTDMPAQPPVLPAEQLAPAELSGLMGRPVLGPQGTTTVGRIVDLLVDNQGKLRATVVDVGGFMGVGSRKVALALSAFRFSPGEKGPNISVAIELDRIRGWAEYVPGRPVAILGGPEVGVKPDRP